MLSKEKIQDALDLCERGWEDEAGERAICEALHALLPGAKPLRPHRYTQDVNAAMLLLPLDVEGRREGFEVWEPALGKHAALVGACEEATSASYAAFSLSMACLHAHLAA